MDTTRSADATRTDTVAVTKAVTVPLPIDRAFALFTDGFATWWPRDSYHLGTDVPEALTIEPGVGGRWYERGPDGTECDWGTVLAWDPPHRVVLSWSIDADWRPDAAIDTEVELTFRAVDATATQVDLEHRGLEVFGDRTDEMVGVFGSDHGWGGLMGQYADTAGRESDASERADGSTPSDEVAHTTDAVCDDAAPQPRRGDGA